MSGTCKSSNGFQQDAEPGSRRATAAACAGTMLQADDEGSYVAPLLLKRSDWRKAGICRQIVVSFTTGGARRTRTADLLGAMRPDASWLVLVRRHNVTSDNPSSSRFAQFGSRPVARFARSQTARPSRHSGRGCEYAPVDAVPEQCVSRVGPGVVSPGTHAHQAHKVQPESVQPVRLHCS